MMQCLGGGMYGDAAYERLQDHQCGGGHANFAAPAPPAFQMNRDGGGGRQVESTSLAFGNRVQNGSSNAYACGGNQNCGNGITDRLTTRVNAPPGGRSQISFG